MGTELLEELDFPDVPPGFESFPSFKPKIENIDNEPSCSASSDISHQSINVKLEPGHFSLGKISRSMKRRSGVNNGRFNQCSDDDSDPEQLSQNFPVKPGLPKGVIRGCADCQHCQRVIARWHQEQARRPNLEEVPVFYPSEDEFRDTIQYIEQIRPKAEQYGICRIVPPPSWKPPCPLKDKEIWESSKFATRVQRVDKLQNRGVLRKMSKVQSQSRKKRRRCSKMGNDSVTECGKFLERGEAGFGFEPGPVFTFDAFQKYADDFMYNYFREEDCAEKVEPSVEMIEGEYWRVVEKPTEEIEVLYGADLETGVFGSGFPKACNQGNSSSYEDYAKSTWNLNNLPRIPGSVLCYENADISGVQVPWLYIGMCFSSFCWHVEDHHLYSLNYMHFGAPKLWYGVSGSDAVKLEDAMKKHLPDLFDEQPDLLHKLVTQLSPSILKSEGVPVYRCVQNAGEFVMTFPRAYHSGFNCGFNCAEAVNVAPVDWLPHGQCAVELYREQGRKTTISHDKLLLGAARDAVKANWELNLLRKNTPDNLRWKYACGKDGILAKSLRARVESENMRREFLCKHSKATKMENDFDSTVERECAICFFDLHLSAAGCRCSPNKFACLNHAKQLCPCGWDDKFFLFRYDISELNLLVDALEGKLSAIYRWARLHLGLALNSCISKESLSCLEHPRETKESPKVPNDIVSGVTVLALEAPTKIPSIKISLHAKQKNDPPPQRAISCTPMKSSLCLNSGEHEEESNKQQDKVSQDDHKLNLCDLANAALAALANSNLISDGQKDDCFSCSTSPKDEIDVKCQIGEEQNLSCHCHQGLRDPDASTPDSYAQNIVCVPSIGHSVKVRDDFLIHRSEMRVLDDVRAFPGSPSCSQSSVDKYPRQKGPRIAKVVRRINCNVEPLEFGDVVGGNFWSTNRAIFPKGYKSRVKYIDVLDPSNMGNYISEILDGGSKGPLFMVFLEHCPSEVFVHKSPTKCWEMVREKVNKEITKQHKLGRLNLPPLQPPGSLDGLEMFGFTSPAIIQGIEALDRNCICTEYWSSRPLAQMSRCFQSRGDTLNTGSKSNALDIGVDPTLRALFKKAKLEELHSLMEMMNKNNHSILTRLLNDEIQTRLR